MQGNDTSKYIEFYNKVAKDVLDVWSACLDNLYEKKDNWYYIFAKYKDVFSFLNKDTLKLHEVPSRLNLTKFLFAVISHNVRAPPNNPDDLIILLNDNLIVMKKNMNISRKIKNYWSYIDQKLIMN